MHNLMAMLSESQRLHAALVAAFSGYVTGVFAERGYPLDRPSVEAIEQAATVLDVELADEMELPFTDQKKSPLEIFRAALGLVAASLERRGVMPVGAGPRPRDDDPYGLVPGSSSVLGPEAHEAHVAWGVAKAAAFTGQATTKQVERSVVVVASDRGEREAIVVAIRERGLPCRAVRNPAGVAAAIEEGAALAAAVDLSHRSGREIISRLVTAGISTVVYGDAVDDLVTTGLLAQGVHTVVERGRFISDPLEFLPTLA